MDGWAVCTGAWMAGLSALGHGWLGCLHRGMDGWAVCTGAWVAGLSAQAVNLDVLTVIKQTHCVLLTYGDVCWHIDTGVLEHQIADIFDCPREGCSMTPSVP
jgi:hypothetical protein